MMQTVVASTTIHSGPEPIWELLSDPNRYPDYVDATERMTYVSESDFGVGYTYKEYGGVKPFLSDSEWKVIEYEPMKHQMHIGDDGKMKMPLELDLRPADDGTEVTIKFSMEPRWYMAPAAAVLWPIMMHKRSQAVLDNTVQNLKRLVEAPSN